jgi:hypothetical protein
MTETRFFAETTRLYGLDFRGDGRIFGPVPDMHPEFAFIELDEHLRWRLCADVSCKTGDGNRQTTWIDNVFGP